MLKSKLLIKILNRTGLPFFLMSLVLFGAFGYNITNVLIELKDKGIKADLESRSNEIGNWFDKYRAYLAGLAQSSDKISIEGILNDHIANDEAFLFLAYVDIENSSVSSTKNLFDAKLTQHLINEIKNAKNIDTFLLNAYKDDKTGIVTTMVFHKLDNGDYLGLAIKLNILQERLESMKFGKGAFAFLADASGMMVQAKSKFLIMTTNVKTGDKAGFKNLNKTGREYFENPRFMVRDVVAPTGHNLVSFIRPLEKTNNWIFAYAYPKLNYYAEIIFLAIRFLIYFIVITTIILIIAIRSLKSTLNPINQMNGILYNLADESGNSADLTKRLKIIGKDEISELAKNFNSFMDILNSIVVSIKDTNKGLQGSVEIASTNVDAVMQSTDIQVNEINMVATGMNQLSATIQDVANHSQQAAQTTSSGKDESHAGSQTVQEVIHVISQQARNIENTSRQIQELNDASSQIGEVMDVINAIAEQTNLLALNAAIEAARAGDAGRGFAVVADEVRNLAGRTHESTEQISSTIASLRENIANAVIIMTETQNQSQNAVEKVELAGKALNGITSSIDHIESLNLLIASATEEQAHNSNELNENLARIIELSDNVQISMKDIIEVKNNLHNLAKDLDKLVNRFII